MHCARWWRFSGLVLVAVVAVGACGSDGESAGATESCAVAGDANIAGTDSCTDYLQWPSGSVAQLCSIPGTRYGAGACPKANRVGGCRGTGIGAGYIRWYYPRSDASTTVTAADVMKDCLETDPPETFVQP